MADFEDGFYDEVTGDAAVAAVISTRFYRTRAPQEPGEPYGVYKTNPKRTLMSMGRMSGLSERRMDIGLFGPEPDTLEDLAESLRLALGRFRGEKLGGTNIRMWVHEFDILDEPFADPTDLFQVPCTVGLFHTEDAV